MSLKLPQFINSNADLSAAISGIYNPWLVILSVLVASFGAFTALQIAERLSKSEKVRKYVWLVFGATAMGSGIWTMHFIGMLAYSLPLTVSYDLTITMMSMLPGILASGIALYFMNMQAITVWRLNLGGLLMGVGIAVMHYTGMTAMTMNAEMRYDPVLFVISIMVAHILSTVALYVKFVIGRKWDSKNPYLQIISAGTMGCAVAGMHYTGMAAAYHFPGSGDQIMAPGLPPMLLAVFVTIGTTVILGTAIISVLIDRKLMSASDALTYSELYSAELEQRVSERTKDLKEANTKLKDLDRLKSMFIASMSHELRTPLNSIIGFTGIILQGMVGELNAKQKDHLGRVYRASNHLLGLISEVIDISKIEAGKIEAFPQEFGLDELINEVTGSVQTQLVEQKLDLVVAMPQGIRLHTDRRRLLQCVLNYVSNAVKYTEDGEISIAAREIDSQIEIAVSDTGIGICEEDMAKIFQPFARLDSPLKIKSQGTGLGLYLTRKLVTEVLGGNVDVKSQPRKGSTFSLKVPEKIGKGTNFSTRAVQGDLQ